MPLHLDKKEGHLFYGIGERGVIMMEAQDLSNPSSLWCK